MDTVGAQCFTASVELGLDDAAGVNSRFTSDVQLLTFTGQGKSVRDFERAIDDLLPHDLAAV